LWWGSASDYERPRLAGPSLDAASTASSAVELRGVSVKYLVKKIIFLLFFFYTRG
jgi:hypothetical protein